MQLATQEEFSVEGSTLLSTPASKTPDELAHIVSQFASSEGWMDRVRLRSEERWYERLYLEANYDIWAISWMPGQSTGFHDHGDSAGAFVVATGTLEEHRPGERPHVIHAGQPQRFGSDYAHDVRNVSSGPAVSIHAYSPPLDEMNEYELEGGRLVPREHASERARSLVNQSLDLGTQNQEAALAKKSEGRTIDSMLAAARARLRRLSPEAAYEAVAGNEAILVDIRPERQRAVEGSVPGAWIVERNVLEWRFDPASSARLAVATDHDVPVIVFCSEGYTSSLAASALQDLGLWRATDIEGGFQAWRRAGLAILQSTEE